MKRLFPFLLFLLPLVVSAGTLHFPYNPTLSPDAKTIYFSYDGDIFNVPAEGGMAMRFVSLGAIESHPKVSPDGKWVAFASNIQGNYDIYVVPTAGGEVQRLTWHEANDYPSGWSADSKKIYFESNRANTRTTYSVSVDGGTPVRLFENYFNTINNLVENPATGELYFNESSESYNFPTRKRYVGDHNPNIKSWNPATEVYRELTSYEGKDAWPMVDKDGNLYYVTDQFNKESNIAKYVPGGAPKQLTSFDYSLQYPSISYDGSKMVFILEYKIHCLDLATGKVSQPSIAIADNNVEVVRSFDKETPRGVAVSPDGKKFAMAIRGMLYISDVKGKYQVRLNTPENERVDELVWAKDNRTVYFTRTNKGYTNLYKIKADGSSAEQLVYSADCNIKNLTPSHNRDRIAFVRGNHNVMVVNTATDVVEKVADAQFWSYGTHTLNFSPDDQYLTFEAVNLFEGEVYVYSFRDKVLHNITNSACSEGSPVFSPDGKYLYMVADFYGTSYPRGGGETQVYKLPLDRYNPNPFKSDVYDKLFEEVKKDEPAPEKSSAKRSDKKGAAEVKKEEPKGVKVNILFDDILRRAIPMKINARSLYIFKNKDKSWLLYSSRRGTQSLEISDPDAKPKEIKDLSWGYFTSSDNDLYFVGRNGISKVDLNMGKATKVEIKVPVEKDVMKEFEQMFYEAWAAMDQNFYDVTFHGVDWAAKRDYYASFLPHVRSRANLSTLMADMLGELNSSHLGFRSSGNEVEAPLTKTYSMETGIIWDNANPYTIDRILTDSPANTVEAGIQKGDLLVAVNGVKVDPKINRESYLAAAVQNPEVKMTFSRAGKEFDVKLHTVTYGAVKNWLYNEWEDVNRALVDKLGNGQIAYSHMRDMGGEELNEFLKDMHTRTLGKKAIILDLRYNNGGNVHNEVLEFLAQKAHYHWSYRDFPANSHPNVTPGDMKIVALVNERSLSDAEVTSNGIQTLGLATIVGTETYRWIIFTSGTSLLDGSYLRLPAWGCYSLDGKDLEFTGVKPDIYVKNTFEDRIKGRDPQLERAIEEALK